MNGLTILNEARLPARCDVATTARELGFQPHDIAVLAAAKLLKPLGNPAPNAPKYFARFDIEQKASDIHWLDKATRAISEHWRRKNQNRREVLAGAERV